MAIETTCSLITGEDVISDLRTKALDNIIMGPSSAYSAAATALDNSFSPAEIKELLELVKLGFETATAGSAFAASVIAIVKARGIKALLVKGEKKPMQVDENTKEEDILEYLDIDE